MQDPYVIMTRGFKNRGEHGRISGYEFNIRIPYYRGTLLSLVHYLGLSVDGQAVSRDHLRVRVAGREFTLEQMEQADDVRWAYGAPATLLVEQPGGLKPGIHEIEVGVTIRKSYLPSTDPERIYDFFDLWKDGVYKTFIEPPTVVRRRMTLVQ